MNDPIIVTPAILEAINAVRDTGSINMFDSQGVGEIANELGYPELRTGLEEIRLFIEPVLTKDL